MKSHRICTNTGCLFVLKPTVVQYGEDKDENAKLDVMDANRKCPKCNAHLTKYIHKVWDYVKDNEEIVKQFAVVDKPAVEAKQAKYKAAIKQVEDMREEAARNATQPFRKAQ